MFITISYPTPVLNTANFSFCFGGKDGRSLPLDDQGFMRNLETILLPGSSLIIKEHLTKHICKIETSSYSGKNLYIDKRFLKETSQYTRTLPTINKICETLKNLIGTSYLWGGNWPMGIPKMRELYPPKGGFSSLPENTQNAWLLKGVDCSGLLYYATNGNIPRNTSDLVTYATSLHIEGLKGKDIIPLLKPLDLLVWKGHVTIVIDNKSCIESTPKQGVHRNPLSQTVEKLLETRKAVNQYQEDHSFIVCRWYLGF